MSFRRKSSKKSVQKLEECVSPTVSISPPPLSPQSAKSKKQNRKHKSKSLIVPPTLDSFAADNFDCRGNGDVRSAGADSPLLELRRRFSFRNFRRCRSVSKSRTTDSASLSQSPTNEVSTVNSVICSGGGSGRPTITVASDTDSSGRCDTPTSTSPLPPSSALRKFLSFVDICLFFTKLQRPLTLTRARTGNGNIHLFIMQTRWAQRISRATC